MDVESKSAADAAAASALIQAIRRREKIALAQAGVLPFGRAYPIMQRLVQVRNLKIKNISMYDDWIFHLY